MLVQDLCSDPHLEITYEVVFEDEWKKWLNELLA
jgi:hypothetical protein